MEKDGLGLEDAVKGGMAVGEGGFHSHKNEEKGEPFLHHDNDLKHGALRGEE